MGMVCGDFDNDGDTDIFVLNDVAGNYLFQNDGTGKFEEAGLRTGTAYNVNGDETGSMGVDCGDYDNDGWLDLMMTTYQNELPVLYRNLGNGTVEDVTKKAGLLPGGYGIGVLVGDYDNDGFVDLYVSHYGTNRLYHNNRNGTFFATRSIISLPHLWTEGERCFVVA